MGCSDYTIKKTIQGNGMRILSRMGLLSIFFVLSACSSHHRLKVLGYIEGRYVYLSSPVSGKLIQLAVQKGETVVVKQLAFQLDPQPELSQLNATKAVLQQEEQTLEDLKKGQRETIIKQIEAQIQQAQANVIYSKKMYERDIELRKTGAISQAGLDQARSQYQNDAEKLNQMKANLAEAKLGARTNLIAAQEARVKSSENQVAQYEWSVSQKTVYIPADGFVQDTLFRQDEFVPAGKPVIQFLPPENRILVFFVPEKKLSQIKPGATVHFTCDGCQKNIMAKIDYISSQAEYTPPVIYSIDSREKLVYWVEAKIDPTVIKNMNPGEPVEVTIDLDKESHL